MKQDRSPLSGRPRISGPNLEPRDACSGEPDAGDRSAEPEPAARVLDPAFSRNRNFDWYDTDEGRTLRTFRRIIQGLLTDLERAGPDEPIQCHPSSETGRVWLELYIPRLRAVRRACLHETEFRALQAHPEIGPRLVRNA